MNSRTYPKVFRIPGPVALLPVAVKKAMGCMVCGQELTYLKEETSETCQICGLSFPTHARCLKGHYVCDTCHASDTLTRVKALLIASKDPDPMSLVLKIFDIPGLNMHGPEYHSIVPAVLVTAYQNTRNVRHIDAIHEALERGRSVKGGSCGLHGNCGAGVGAGIAVSILEEATPLSRQERSAANRATALALLAISENAGPRCCKRDAVTSIESFIATTSYFGDRQHASYTCRQFAKNNSCMGKTCPYHPAASPNKAK